MKKEFEKTYAKMIRSDEILPEEWQNIYEVTACLKDTPGKQTFLIQDKTDGTKYILKLAEKEEALHLLEEAQILQELQEAREGDEIDGEIMTGIRDLIRIGDTVYLLRNYIEGFSLAEIGQMHGFAEEEIRRIGILLCRSVMKLHQRRPPLIHRDIKPENIIVKRDQSLVLIDMETARSYKEGKREDTYFAGTRETAAPEQYGFGQSDERTDVYGIGRTLLYMVTGDYLLEDLQKVSGDRRLCGIIRKCCSIDPNSRYSSVEKLMRELQRCRLAEKKREAGIRVLTAVVLLLCAAVAALSLQVWSLKRMIGLPEHGSRSDKHTQAQEMSEETQKDVNDNGERIIINGWNVTAYDLLLEQIIENCNQKEYRKMAQQCGQLLTALYEDEKLISVAAEDTYYYEQDDERWEPYQIVRLGYEKVADDLAYHDEMLRAEAGNLEQYQYHIALVMRGFIETTETDQEGNEIHSLLYQYQSTQSGERRDIDYSIHELVETIIMGIELYQEEN